MTTFTVYLRLGFEHLLDLQGYDHILFLAVLCAAYSLTRWRELLILVTAFTIGHSVSLALATISLVRVDSALVEFLIPVTIVATALFNLALVQRDGRPRRRSGKAAAKRRGRKPRNATKRRVERRSRYAAALLFGVIHGLGFSNFLRLALGQERDILVPLLSFNIGLELAQIVVAAVLLVAAFIATRVSVPERAWNIVVSTAAGATAAVMAAQRWPF